MLIVYDSLTGNTRRFIKKLHMLSIQLEESMNINEEFVLITYTTGFGNVPLKVERFLENNYEYLKGVSASGNRNWGDSFCASAESISRKYKVPIISKFELSGTNKDVENFKEGVKNLEILRA